MKTEIIKGVKYNLLPVINEVANCTGCAFKGTEDCTALTKCCDHEKKYGAMFIYRLPVAKPELINPIVWIVKEKKSGRYLRYCRTREDARDEIFLSKYHKGFGYKSLVIVKGMVTEL